jgi:hypothetical protein
MASIQHKQAHEMQVRTRKERDFDRTESDLPDYSGSGAASSKLATKNKFNDLLSYLGSRNPLPRAVSDKDTVWLLDNTAYRNAKTGKWEAEFVSAVFEQHPSCTVVDAVAAVAKKLDLDETHPDFPTIQARILPFLQDIRPGTQVKALQSGNTKLVLGPGGRNGVSSDTRKLPDSESSTLLVPSTADVPKGANGLLEMRTFYAEPEGWGVISGE